MTIIQFTRRRGDDACLQTGLAGPTAATEFLMQVVPFQEAVMEQRPTQKHQEVAIEQGTPTVWQDGLNRVIKGQTVLEEILCVIAIDAP